MFTVYAVMLSLPLLLLLVVADSGDGGGGDDVVVIFICWLLLFTRCMCCVVWCSKRCGGQPGVGLCHHNQSVCCSCASLSICFSLDDFEVITLGLVLLLLLVGCLAGPLPST